MCWRFSEVLNKSELGRKGILSDPEVWSWHCWPAVLVTQEESFSGISENIHEREKEKKRCELFYSRGG